ncbi:hypothetical protein L0152_26165 [bacterium]|nr:hypothetical protein [bacterium]
MTKVLSSNLKAVAEQISNTAIAQGKESIERAIQSFSFIEQKQLEDVIALLNENRVHDAAYAEDPLKYFTEINKAKKNPEGKQLVSAEQVILSLRNQHLHYHDGVTSFLKTGIQEALASLKINASPNSPPDGIALNLDELLSPTNLANPDRKKLQASLKVMNEMFLTLRKMQMDVSNLRLNMLHSVRA